MIVKSFSYTKSEKLKSRKLLNQLFQEGKSLNAFPVKLIYKSSEKMIGIKNAGDTEKIVATNKASAINLLAGVGVSSRNFKKAVDRNRIKRLLRESFRLQKHLLDGLNETEQQWQVFFLYTGKDVPELSVLQAKLQLLMNKLMEQFTKPV